MAAGNKHCLAVPLDLLCIRCKSRLTAEKNIGNDYQTTQNNSTSQELENLHEDMLELNKVLRVVERYSVKNAILAEIDLISAKIDSLHQGAETGIGGVGNKKVTSKRDHRYQRLAGEACISCR